MGRTRAATSNSTSDHQRIDGATSTSQTSGTFPASCEVVFDTDLPNGPYGEMAAMSAKIHVPPNSDYNKVGKAMLDAWIKSRGSMTNMQMQGTATMASSEYKEDWRIISIEYKGGAVDPTAIANEGTHNVQLGIVQTVKPTTCACAIM